MSKENKLAALFWLILFSSSVIIALLTEFKYGVIFLFGLATLNWIAVYIREAKK